MAQAASSAAMDVANNKNFQDRIAYLMAKAAVSVMSEVGTTPGHAERVVYAKKILASDADVHAFTIAVLTNGTIAAAGFNAADADLEFTVNSLFSAFAGVAT